MVGSIAFGVDAGTLLGVMQWFGLGYYAGRAISFLAASSVAWPLHRSFTFRYRTRNGKGQQWVKFVMVNGVGGLANYGVYAGLVMCDAMVRAHPTAGVAAGAVCAMSINFLSSKRFVFKEDLHTAEEEVLEIENS